MDATDDQMSAVDESGCFSVVKRRKKKEKKRKAERVIESDSEPIKEQRAPSTEGAQKKMKKAIKTAPNVEPNKELISVPCLKDRASAALKKMIEIVTSANIESAVAQKIMATAADMKEIIVEALMMNSRLEGKI